MDKMLELIQSGEITPETAQVVQAIAETLQHYHTPPTIETALERFEHQKSLYEEAGISFDAFVLRAFRLHEILNVMENEYDNDKYWDTVFPNLDWCKYELKKLGFHRDYDKLYKVAEAAGVSNENPYVPDVVMAYRETPPDMDDSLGSDDRAMLITALRYQQHFLNRLDYPQDGGFGSIDFIDEDDTGIGDIGHP